VSGPPGAPPVGPPFREPWEAQAFAMAVALHARGLFTWAEWAERLSREIAAAPAPDPRGGGDRYDDGGYYLRWLTALEGLAAEKGATTPAELLVRKDAWDRAARATPHGTPVEPAARD